MQAIAETSGAPVVSLYHRLRQCVRRGRFAALDLPLAAAAAAPSPVETSSSH